MLPPEWKDEIEACVSKATDGNQENEKRRIESQNAIAAPLDRLANEFVTYKDEQRKADKGKCRREMATITGLFVTCFFTIVLAAAAIAQAYAFMQSERAFVFPDHVEFADRLESVAEKPLILLEIGARNHGKSVAKIREITIVISHILPPRPVYGRGINDKQFVLPPIPAAAQIKETFPFDVWPRQTMLNVRNGNMPFYVYGKIEYVDEFKLFFWSRISQFCFVYLANAAEPSKGRFGNCPQPGFTSTD